MLFFTSIATTTPWLPMISAAAATISGFSTATVFRITFSTPMSTSRFMSSIVRYPAAVGERHERLRRNVGNQVEVRPGACRSGADVPGRQLLRLLVVEDLDGVDRVTDVLRLPESDRLHQPRFLSSRQGITLTSCIYILAKFFSSCMSRQRWLFSG